MVGLKQKRKFISPFGSRFFLQVRDVKGEESVLVLDVETTGL